MPPLIDEVFEDERFASLYDYFNPWDRSDEFYLELARERGGAVLDLGCGTGMLACRIAQHGCAVTGVDPAEAMLNVARSRSGSERVTWLKARGQDLRSVTRYDLIYMAGHAFQALLSDADAIALLQSVRHHLKTGGRFAFASRNPARRAWLDWTPDKRKLAETDEHGRIEEFFETDGDPIDGIVNIVHHYRFLDVQKHITGRSRIRFVDGRHLAGLLSAARLAPGAWYGDWDRAPLMPASPEFVIVAARGD
jgi:SAM-dependent methyltransferase